MSRSKLFASSLALLCAAFASAQGTPFKDQRVILVLLDGLRWQEVFRGPEEAMMVKEQGVDNVDALKKAFWRDTALDRRENLMPFLWGTLAKQGQIYGNRDEGSPMRVTNGKDFSYPGYSEMIVGYPDDRINSNAPNPNPNVSVFEWLNRKDAYKGKVAVFGAWDVVRAIVNPERSKLLVNAGTEPVTFGPKTPHRDLLNTLKADLHHPWGTEPYDAITFYSALDYLKTAKPKAMWITFGETDEFAHERQYDDYLEAIQRSDRLIKKLWETLQSMKEYKGKTTLIISVDHGRGTGNNWTGHAASIEGSYQTWLAAIGPHTRPLGMRRNIPQVTTSQIAATVAACLGEDYAASDSKIASPIWDLIRS